MNAKKLIAILLALVLVLGMAACGSKEKEEAAPESGPAPVQKEEQNETEDPVHIIWKARGDEPANYDSVMAAINEMLLKELNCTLEIDYLGGEFGEKMNLIIGSGENWDLAWTANWNGANYKTNAEDGAYLELEGLLETYAPDVWATIPEAYWDAVKIDGHIYGMINYQICCEQNAYTFDKAAMDAAGITIPETCYSQEEFGKILAQIKEAYPNSYPMIALDQGLTPGQAHFGTAEDYHSTLINGSRWMYYDHETLSYDWDAFMNDEWYTTLSYAKAWCDAGYAPEDQMTLEETDELYLQDVVFIDAQRYTPTAAAAPVHGEEVYWMKIGPATVGGGGIQSTLTAVNYASENPEKALQVYNFFFSNAEAANMLFFGLEGQDYTVNEDGTITQIEGGYSNAPWAMGNTFLGYVLEGQPANINELTLEMDQNAIPDPLFGFSFDTTPVEAEMTAVNAVWKEYDKILICGEFDNLDETLAELHSKLEAAGAQTLEDEVNRQIQAFVAANS